MKTKTVSNLLISTLHLLENHSANSNDALLGNRNELKTDGLGRSYISGQSVRHALAKSMRDILENGNYEKLEGQYISNADAPNQDITKDIRTNLFGFMAAVEDSDEDGNDGNDDDENKPAKKTRKTKAKAQPDATTPGTETVAEATEESSGGMDKRTGLLRVSPLMSHSKANLFTDFLVAYKEDSSKNQIAQVMHNTRDHYTGNFALNLSRIGLIENPKYNGKTIGFDYDYKQTEEIMNELACLYLDGIKNLSGFAKQNSSAINASPQKILIVLEDNNNTAAFNYFSPNTSEQKRKNYLLELEDRGIKYFLGSEDDESFEKTVYSALKQAKQALKEQKVTRFGVKNSTENSVNELELAI